MVFSRQRRLPPAGVRVDKARRHIALLSAVLLVSTVAVESAVGPADAHPLNGSLWGPNEDAICWVGTPGCAGVTRGNIVGFWQTVLLAEGLFPYPCSHIDGQFGPETAFWTGAYQQRYGLPNDQIVGGRYTWPNAEGHLTFIGNNFPAPGLTGFEYAYGTGDAFMVDYVSGYNAWVFTFPGVVVDQWDAITHPDLNFRKSC